MTTSHITPLLELMERLPSAGRVATLAAIADAGDDGIGAVGIHDAGAAPTLGMAAYHVRKLLADELVELVRTEPRRGAVASFYRLTPAGRRMLGLIDTAAAALATHAQERGTGAPLEVVR